MEKEFRWFCRSMRGDDAKEKCPEIILVRGKSFTLSHMELINYHFLSYIIIKSLLKVPEVRGKADLTKYRNAGELFKINLNS
jgi:hypothetical protein